MTEQEGDRKVEGMLHREASRRWGGLVDDSVIDTSLLSVKEVANLLGVCPATVNGLVRDGKLTVVKLTNRSSRFTLYDVADYIKSRRVRKEIPIKRRRGRRSKQKEEAK